MSKVTKVEAQVGSEERESPKPWDPSLAELRVYQEKEVEMCVRAIRAHGLTNVTFTLYSQRTWDLACRIVRGQRASARQGDHVPNQPDMRP